MTHKFTEDDHQVIEQFLEHGAHLVPYLPDKAIPSGFKWTQMRIESMDTVKGFNEQDCGIAFVINSVNAVLVDIDLPLNLSKDEMQQTELEFRDYKKIKKQQWQAMPESERHAILAELASRPNFRDAGLMPSSSGMGMHIYYHVDNAHDFCRGGPTIEIFANRRLAFVTDWSLLADYWLRDPLPWKMVKGHWLPIAKELDIEKQTPKAAEFKFNPLIRQGGTIRFDYKTFLSRSNKAAVSDADYLWVWLVKAFQLNDAQAIQDALADARTRISEKSVLRQYNGARTFAARNPGNAPQLGRAAS